MNININFSSKINFQEIPIYDISTNNLDADVIIPHKRVEFEYMWDNKIFDFMIYESSNKVNNYIFYFKVEDKDWIFENREALNYISAQDLWRSSPEFFEINQIVYKTLQDFPDFISRMKNCDNVYKGIKQDKVWDFSDKNKNFKLYIKEIQIFCKIVEYSDFMRTGKYIQKIKELSNKILEKTI